MKYANVYGQGSGGLKVNDVEKTTVVIKNGSTINIGDLISYSGSEVIKRDILNDISIGSEYAFSYGETNNISAVSLTDTKVLVCYTDYSNNRYGTAKIITIDGNTIDSSSGLVFKYDYTYHISAVKLTDNKVLVSYQDYNNTHRYGTSIVLNISGINITKGNEYIFENGDTGFISAVSLTSTKVLVSYRNYSNSDYGTAIVLNISGNVITSGSPYVFCTNVYNTFASYISNTKILVIYSDSNNNYYSTAIVLNISGNTITSGSPYVFNNHNNNDISAISLSETKLLLCYQGINSYGTIVIFDIDGTNITVGDEYIFNNNITYQLNALKLSSNKILIIYRNRTTIFYGAAIIITIDGNTMIKGSEYSFNNPSYIDAVLLSDKKAVATYINYDTNRGAAIVLDVSKTDIEGIALKSGTGGETIDIYKF